MLDKFKHITKEIWDSICDALNIPKNKWRPISALRVSPRACYNYQIAKDSVFYMDSTTKIQDHGELYVSRPDGKNERILDEELYNFQIVDNEYIYYLFRHDTLGVGIEGHALQRMNLDGTNKMIVAYEVFGAGFGCRTPNLLQLDNRNG